MRSAWRHRPARRARARTRRPPCASAEESIGAAHGLVDAGEHGPQELRDAEREVHAALAAEGLVGEVGAAGTGLGAGHDAEADVGAERVGLRGEHGMVVTRSVDRDGRALLDQPAACRRAQRREPRVHDEEQAPVAEVSRVRAGACRARGRRRPDPAASEPTLTSVVIVAGPHTASGTRPRRVGSDAARSRSRARGSRLRDRRRSRARCQARLQLAH